MCDVCEGVYIYIGECVLLYCKVYMYMYMYMCC